MGSLPGDGLGVSSEAKGGVGGVLRGCGGANGVALAKAGGRTGCSEGWQEAKPATGSSRDTGGAHPLEACNSQSDTVVEAHTAENLSGGKILEKRYGEEAAGRSGSPWGIEESPLLVHAEPGPHLGDLPAEMGSARPSKGGSAHRAVVAAEGVVPGRLLPEKVDERVPGVPGAAVGEGEASGRQGTDAFNYEDDARPARSRVEGRGKAGVEAGAAGNPNPLALLMRSAAERGDKTRLPGQFLFPLFISEVEEAKIVRFLDDCKPPWKLSRFNGPHR